MTPSELAEHRMKESQRVKQYREKKANSNNAQPELSISSTPYRSSQARGKAIKRVKQSLPFSPRKRRCVVEFIAMEVGLNVASSPVSIDYCGLSEDTKQLVLAFYNINEVSWPAPGRKDKWLFVKPVLMDLQEQLQYILTSLREAHHLYSIQHSANNIGLNKFCKNVKLFEHIPHNVVFAHIIKIFVSCLWLSSNKREWRKFWF